MATVLEVLEMARRLADDLPEEEKQPRRPPARRRSRVKRRRIPGAGLVEVEEERRPGLTAFRFEVPPGVAEES